ncbi:hypothetical protein IFR05_017343, partial [Cadophora sp. M221]
MPRTSTTHFNIFTRPGSVTYTLPSPPYSSPYTTITLPVGSTWTSGLHWHETHTEFLQIISGAALITLNNSTHIYTSSEGILTIPRYAKHEWQRASRAQALGYNFFFHDSDSSSAGELEICTPQELDDELVVREWTQPSDGQKEIFFRNLSGIISYSSSTRKWYSDWYVMLQLWILFAAMDNWPVFLQVGNVPLFGGWMERLGVARVVEWAAA